MTDGGDVATRVLVVEDDVEAAAFFRDALSGFGYEPVIVGSAEAAGHVVATEHVDVILLDVRLPSMSGVEFIHAGIAREAGIPIVAVSGVATEEEARDCLQRGALDFLPKPVSLDLLREVLRYAEVHTVASRLDAAGRPIDRRRSPRVPVAIPVRVIEESGAEWQGTCVDLSTFGVRIRPQASIRLPVSPVRIVFVTPGGAPAVGLLSASVRADPDGHVFRFVNLYAATFQQLRGTVAQLEREP